MRMRMRMAGSGSVLALIVAVSSWWTAAASAERRLTPAEVWTTFGGGWVNDACCEVHASCFAAPGTEICGMFDGEEVACNNMIWEVEVGTGHESCCGASGGAMCFDSSPGQVHDCKLRRFCVYNPLNDRCIWTLEFKIKAPDTCIWSPP